VYFNARCLINKRDLLSATISDLQPDIIGITETWASEAIFDSELSISGYDMYRCDRPFNRKCGGVMLYVKCSLGSVEFRPTTDYPEQVWCSVRDGREELIIGVVYRTQDDNLFQVDMHQKLCELLNEVKDRHLILMRDFNYPYIDWRSLQCDAKASDNCRTFLECVEDCFLTHTHST